MKLTSAYKRVRTALMEESVTEVLEFEVEVLDVEGNGWEVFIWGVGQNPETGELAHVRHKNLTTAKHQAWKQLLTRMMKYPVLR